MHRRHEELGILFDVWHQNLEIAMKAMKGPSIGGPSHLFFSSTELENILDQAAKCQQNDERGLWDTKWHTTYATAKKWSELKKRATEISREQDYLWSQAQMSQLENITKRLDEQKVLLACLAKALCVTIPDASVRTAGQDTQDTRAAEQADLVDELQRQTNATDVEKNSDVACCTSGEAEAGTIARGRRLNDQEGGLTVQAV